MDTLEKYQLLLQKVNQMLGVPYIWGGQSEASVDCSGLIQVLYSAIGLDPPGDQTAQGIYNHFARLPSTKENVFTCGSLAFFGFNTKRIYHVGMFIDPDTICHAGGGGPDCTTVEIARAKDAKVKLDKISHFKNLVAVLRPEF